MANDRRTLRALAALLPAGALGLSMSLAAADAGAAKVDGAAQPASTSVAQRLQSIRNSVSTVVNEAAKDSAIRRSIATSSSPGGAMAAGATAAGTTGATAGTTAAGVTVGATAAGTTGATAGTTGNVRWPAGHARLDDLKYRPSSSSRQPSATSVAPTAICRIATTSTSCRSRPSRGCSPSCSHPAGLQPSSRSSGTPASRWSCRPISTVRPSRRSNACGPLRSSSDMRSRPTAC